VGNVTGVGVAGTIPEWTSATSLGNSPITHFLGLINFNTHALTNVVDPTNLQDAATKNYVDTTAGGTGNVSYTQSALNYIPKWSPTGNLVNSTVVSNTTAIYFLDDVFTDRWSSVATNTFFGMDVTGGAGVLSGGMNTAYGNDSVYNITSGDSNTAIGWRAAYGLTTGDYNTAVGDQSLLAVSSGVGNTAVGEIALGTVSTTSFNTGVGSDVLWQNTGSYNTAVGANAGGNNLTGDSNVFIGYAAGEDELGSNKLYIDNSDDATPLIYGDFATDTVTINTTLSMAGNINMVGGATVDGVDISTLSAGSGNVTAAGMTTGYIPVATSTTGLTNSIISANSTNAEVNLILGAELAPAMTQADWTEGANWTINDGAGTATRVASAVTTLVPTVAIVPTIGSRYQVTFTISGWTAGQVTVTLGGIVSTPLQGNQNVHLFFSPYTTDNLIFTPDASFAGVITLVSVKAMTGGYLTVDNDIYSYDSRGHLNRMGNMIRHLNEMATDTLLDKSRSTLSCAGGVLTYTLYAVYGQGTWNFNGVVYPGAVASANVTLTGGTDDVPKTNWVYFDLNGNTPRLAASTTAEPTTTHIMVAEFIVGAVSGSSYNIYAYNRYRVETDSFVKRVIERAENSGTLYESGSLPTVTQNTPWISVASGGKWYAGIFKHESGNTVNGTVFYFIKNGVYTAGTSLADLLFYTDATAVPNHGFANIVWGIVPTTTTASGTVPTTVKLVACLQTKPTVDYFSITAVRQDLYEATNYYPPDTQLKECFVPIARTIISEDAPTQLQTFDTGIYWKDLRGRVTSGGGAATGTDTSGLLDLAGTRSMTGSLNMGTTGNITMAAGMLVDGVDVSTLSTVLTNPMLDDVGLGFGTDSANRTQFLFETADANANCMVIALPDGGATDVPVLVIGDQGVINADLTWFNGITKPAIAVVNAAESNYVTIRDTSLYTNNSGFSIRVGSDTYYTTFNKGGASNVPTLYGTGAYLRVGDAATTSRSLAAEDDLMVSGKLEVDGSLHTDGMLYVWSALEPGNTIAIRTTSTDNQYYRLQARDNTVGYAEVARVQSAADPYFQIGRDDTGVATNAVTDMLVLQAGASTNATAVNFGLGTSWKLSNSASEVEERGSIDLVSSNVTNGSEKSTFKFSVMDAGAMVNPSLSIDATSTSTTLTPATNMIINGSFNYGADAGASDTYACTITGISAYVTGMPIYFKANTVNTGACSINVNTLGAKALKINGGADDPADGWIKANEIVHCVYDGTNFQVINPDATP
jgi:hypothetical protein